MKKAVTVGLLASGISDNFSMMICRGAMRAAREQDVRRGRQLPNRRMRC